jgi:uncharacterized protein YggE
MGETKKIIGKLTGPGLVARAGGILAVVVAGAVMAACSSSSDPVAAKPTCGGSAPKLTVQGTGLATGTPTILTASVAINVTDPTANQALSDDNTKAAAVTAVLTQGGVAAKDVQTSDLSINPQYNSRGVITGYQVSNTLTAVIRSFSTAGSLIDSVAGAGGNSTQINSLNFSVEDTRGLEDQARTDAVHQAVSHAKTMAEAADERLGPVCSLTDQTQTGFSYPQDFANQDAAAGAPAKATSTVPLEPGSQQETAQVSMVYALMLPALRK